MNLREAAQQALEYIEQNAIISGIPIRDALRAALAEDSMQRLTDVQQEMEATISKTETVDPATDDCPGCLRLEDQLYDALGRLQIANLKLAGGAAIKITERKVAEWLQKEYSTGAEGTSTIKDNLTVEPVAWITPRQDLHLVNYEGFQDWVPLYTAPPKREPLTDEQIQECIGKVDDARLSGPITEFARAIERAHGIGGEE